MAAAILRCNPTRATQTHQDPHKHLMTNIKTFLAQINEELPQSTCMPMSHMHGHTTNNDFDQT